MADTAGIGQQKHGVRITNKAKVNHTDSIHDSSPLLQSDLQRSSSV